MTRKARRPAITPPLAEPEAGSPADWYARGFCDGTLHAAEQGVREVAALEMRVRAFAQEVGLLAREMQHRYGARVFQPDRWDLHPAYRIGVEMFDRQAGAAAAPQAAPGPTLTLGGSAPAEPELAPDAEMRRAHARFWRA